MALAYYLQPKNPVDPVQLPHVEEPVSLCAANLKNQRLEYLLLGD